MGARDAGVYTHMRLLHLFHVCFGCKPASLLVFHCYTSSLAYEKHTFGKDTCTRTCERVL